MHEPLAQIFCETVTDRLYNTTNTFILLQSLKFFEFSKIPQ